jgi:hypothetical protein
MRPDYLRAAIASFTLVTACGEAPPRSLAADAPIVTVCEAAGQAVGSRIKVRGEFSGTDHATTPTTVTLVSEGVCNNQGGGLVFAEMLNPEQMAKVANAQPRRERPPRAAGAMLVIEGDVTKVDDGRFVHLARRILK